MPKLPAALLAALTAVSLFGCTTEGGTADDDDALASTSSNGTAEPAESGQGTPSPNSTPGPSSNEPVQEPTGTANNPSGGAPNGGAQNSSPQNSNPQSNGGGPQLNPSNTTASGGATAEGGTASDNGGETSVVGGQNNAGGATERDAGASGGTGGASSPSAGCAGRDLILCEDFESTAVGDIPEEWYRLGEEVAVADDEARAGSHSLKLGAIDFWERRIAHDASALGSAHWGRIYYKVALPVPDAFVHSTLVAFSGDGPNYGASEYRFIDTVKQAVDTPDVGSRHNFLFNVQPEDSGEFGRETSYDFNFDGEWHCAEYHVDASNQSYAFYLDGNEELSFEDGAGNYDDSDLPDTFAEVRVGWNNYQEAPPGFTAWMDDIAFDDERVGCE